jgi:serine/threonine protein kinase
MTFKLESPAVKVPGHEERSNSFDYSNSNLRNTLINTTREAFNRAVQQLPQLDLNNKKEYRVESYSFEDRSIIPASLGFYESLAEAPNFANVVKVGALGDEFTIVRKNPGVWDLFIVSIKNIKDLNLVKKGVLEFLKYAHEKGLVHCDINPENVYFEDNRVIVDGASSICKEGEINLDVDSSGFSHPGRIFGCPANPSFDYFGLAATMLYACTGNSFSPNSKNDQLIETVKESFEESGVLKSMDEFSLEKAARAYVAMADYQNFFDNGTFQALVNSVIDNNGDKNLFNAILEKNDEGNYSVKELEHVNIPINNQNLDRIISLGDKEEVDELANEMQRLAAYGLKDISQ